MTRLTSPTSWSSQPDRATALALVSCGSSDSDNLLPGDTASEIVANLDQVKELNADGHCTEAESAVDEVRIQVTELPSSVDPRLRRALAEGAAGSSR